MDIEKKLSGMWFKKIEILDILGEIRIEGILHENMGRLNFLASIFEL